MTDSHKQGWVRLHRKIADNDLWFLEPFTKAQAWIDLFLNANHKDSSFSVRGNIIFVKRGQIGWSELTMVKRWSWSRGKVRRYLGMLETRQQIIQHKTPLTTIITILNYEDHQSDRTTDSTTERQQKDSRRYTNKNVKNVKNDKNVKEEILGDKSPEEFSSKEYIEQVIKDKKPHISLIGKYFKTKQVDFPSLKAARAELVRWTKDASVLAEYPEERINQTFALVSEKFKEEWNLSTIRKYIA